MKHCRVCGSMMDNGITACLVVLLTVQLVLGGFRNSAAGDRTKNTPGGTTANQLIAGTGETKKMPDIEKDTIVIIGASYVQHWPVRKLGGMQVVNRGVNGEQSFEMRRRFTEDVLAVKPRAVIIWGFINDIHRNTSENIDTVKARAKESTAEMVQLARASGIKPIIATEVTIRSKDSLKEKVAGWVGEILGKSSYQAYVNGHVLGVNRWIRDYAQANGILILDFEQLLADEMSFRKKEFATKDGTHISAAGYDELTAYTEKVVGVSTFQN